MVNEMTLLFWHSRSKKGSDGDSTMVINSIRWMLVVLLSIAFSSTLMARQHIIIASLPGTSGYSDLIIEQFRTETRYPRPALQVLEEDFAFKSFCKGVGIEHSDILVASRRISSKEERSCQLNSVGPTHELKFGYGALVLIVDKTNNLSNLVTGDIWRSISLYGGESRKRGENLPNEWAMLDDQLPSTQISWILPPTNSETVNRLIDLLASDGCDLRTKSLCKSFREDKAIVITQGPASEINENNRNRNSIVLDTLANQTGRTPSKTKILSINSQLPQPTTVQFDQYPLRFPLYLYVKVRHLDIIPGLVAFLKKWTSENTWGDEGSLKTIGLVPLTKNERDTLKQEISVVGRFAD